jgi:hypothetical protein
MLVLAFGMVVIGCPTTEAGAEDSWSNVTSLSQLNGTWKGSYAETVSLKEQFGGEWNDEMETKVGSDMKVTASVELTVTINASAKTQSMSMKVTQTYAGSKISTAWAFIKEAIGGQGFTFDDSKHSVSMTENMPASSIGEEELIGSGLKVNQDGTKIKIPADMMGEGAPEMIMTKQ